MINKIIFILSLLSLISCFYAFSILSTPINLKEPNNQAVFENAYQVYKGTQTFNKITHAIHDDIYGSQTQEASSSFSAVMRIFPAVFSSIVLTAFADDSIKKYDKKEVVCLAKNIYFEARNQDKLGQIYVGLVTLGREENTGNSICSVVHKKDYVKIKKRNKNICQFSWVCEDGHYVDTDNIIERKAWDDSVELAKDLIDGKYALIAKNEFKGVLNYHSKKVHPLWAKNMTIVASEGDHIFYRAKAM